MTRWKPVTVLAACLTLGCGDGQLSTDGFSETNGSTTTGANGDTSSGNNSTPNGSSNGSTNGTSGATTSTNGSTNGATNGTSGTNGETGGTNGMTSGPDFHPMFVAVADFMREKCIACHSEGQNGNFQIPSVDSSNQEVRDALEGVEATTGRLLVEPNDPANSQVYIMITNDAGEQFDDATIAIVEDWINAGAPYEP